MLSLNRNRRRSAESPGEALGDREERKARGGRRRGRTEGRGRGAFVPPYKLPKL